jgi:nucleoside-diphosphate-sugar epimerase
MRILVTGGAGFLGAWIIRRLAARGHGLRVFDTTEKCGLVAEIAGSEVAQGCEWRTGDIVSRTAVREAAAGCNAIIHLAGILTPDCRADPIRGAEINLIGTLNVFEAALAHGIRRVVYTSSAGVYGPQDTGLPVPTTITARSSSPVKAAPALTGATAVSPASASGLTSYMALAGRPA